MQNYRPRVADAELRDLMSFMGAVLIDGPKAVGKTATASELAETTFRLDTDQAAIAALAAHPEQLFSSRTPILFDEWQDAQDIWNLVRRAVDDHREKGLYILTGSSRPRDTGRLHSGAGRIGRLRMRPMSLFESGHSSGTVSLAALLAGEPPGGPVATLTVPDLIGRIVVGGWPETIELPERAARAWLAGYNRTIAEYDIPELGPRRNPGRVARLLASLGQAAGTVLNRRGLAIDVGGDNGPIDDKTVGNYLDALERLMLIEPVPAWQPHMRSHTRPRTSAVHHFVDPSLGTAALGVGSAELLADLNAAGLHFESLVMRDLRVYSQPLGATLSSWRDTKENKEVDAVLELPNGRWAGVEIKLGETQADAAATALLHMAGKIDVEKHGEPVALIAITGGRFAYRRPDGVTVVPISVLGP